MSPILIALALAVAAPPQAPVPDAAARVDSTYLTDGIPVDDVLEAVMLKAGIVKQGDSMRL